MTPKEKYKTALAFKNALQERLKTRQQKDGVDLIRLYRQVSFTQLLRRLFADTGTPWVLKGGHALEIRFQQSRATKDIDLALKGLPLKTKSPEERADSIRDLLVEKMHIDLDDFFEFNLDKALLNSPMHRKAAPVF